MLHIVSQHFTAGLLTSNQCVASFDMEGARSRGVALDWVVERAVEQIQRPELLLPSHLVDGPTGRRMDIRGIRIGLVKNLLFARLLGCTAEISWSRTWAQVEDAFPEARHVAVDPHTDCPEHFGIARDFFAKHRGLPCTPRDYLDSGP